MGDIRPIDAVSVHRLHSGQVILSLENTLKELVENCLDAGATVIEDPEVRIKENGLEAVEVIDNGSGIKEADWSSIGLKHHTSKLQNFDDLSEVSTFGFRGEAVSALCALCESVTIVTSTKETAPMGTTLDFDKGGQLVDSSKKIARPRGTTVTLSGLFNPLPVRRKEFERNVKKEFAKAMGLLTAYGLVPACGRAGEDGRAQMGIRLTVDSVSKNGKRTNHLKTDGKPSLRSAVQSIWGPKAADGLVQVDLDLEVDLDKAVAKREGLEATSHQVKVEGLISSAAYGLGRTNTDRQYFYINGRPCSLVKISRAMNEVYKTFNATQSPFAVLDFRIGGTNVDINVSPDKREIFIHSELNLIEAFRTALEQLFQPTLSTYIDHGASQVPSRARPSQGPIPASQAPAEESEEVTPISSPYSSSRSISVGRRDRVRDPAASFPIIRSQLGPVPSVVPSSASSRLTSSQGMRFKDVPAEQLEYAEEDDGEVEKGSEQEYDGDPPVDHGETGADEGEDDEHPPADESMEGLEEAPLAPPSDEEPIDVDDPPVLKRGPPTPPRRALLQTTLDTSRAAWSLSKNPAPSRTSNATRSRAGNATSTLPKGPPPSSSRQLLREKLAGFAGPRSQVVEDINKEEEADEEEEEAEEEEQEVEEEGDADVEEDDGREDMGEGEQADGGEVDELEVDDPPPGQRAAKRRARVDDVPEYLLDPSDHVPDSDSEEDQEPEPSPSIPPSSSRFRDEIVTSHGQRTATVSCSIDRIRSRYSTAMNRHEKPEAADEPDPADSSNILESANLGADAEQAEVALSRVIRKEDFAAMEVLGQFNNSFIIARLRVGRAADRAPTDDLFIIDQHASDEKFNFETLQETTKIRAQKLILPKKLQLTSGDEITATENLSVLADNGFTVDIDEDAPYGRGERIKLVAMPMSKDTTFDFKDLEELIYLMQDRPPGQMVRCKKARAMFASRACRKSVMFGHALKHNRMVQVVRHLGHLDQPWNCPHGRPTMRHLINMTTVNEDESSVYVQKKRENINWQAVKST